MTTPGDRPRTPGPSGRWRSWASDRRLLLDVAPAVLLTVLALADAMGEGYGTGTRDLDAVAVMMVVAAGAALAWRRRMPVVVLTLVGIVTVAFWLRGHGAFLGLLGLPALYSVAVHDDDRRRAWLAMATVVVVLFAVASATVLTPPEGYLWPAALTMAAYLAAAIGVGVVVRNRERLFADTRRRAEQAELDRRAAMERAVTAERARIAREMHDIVAHSMSVISVQASAAREIVHARPDKAVEVLGKIEGVSRESLTEMRRMLGVLRDRTETAPTLVPQPGIGDLPDLVAATRAAGTDVELDVTGDQRRLAPGLELAAFRIVQEALTNVRKHAGSGATAAVTIDFGARVLHLRVTDQGGTNGRGGGPATGTGNGLIGIHERVEVYGGQAAAGPTPDGGWAVTASLPITADDEQTAVAPVGDARDAVT